MLLDDPRLEAAPKRQPLRLQAIERHGCLRLHERDDTRVRPGPVTMRAMEIHFLGGATTVTGSQYLLETEQARVLIDCGMFQGSPNESIRNRVPFDFDPATLDAVLLTHAHLDHCGLLPVLVKAGYRGPIHATAGTIELATLVLLDSGKLHEEFAKREARWEKRHPDEAATEDREEADAYAAAVALAEAGEAGAMGATDDNGQHVATTVEPVPDPAIPASWPRDPEAELRAQPPAPPHRPRRAALHGEGRRTVAGLVPAGRLRGGDRGRAGGPRAFVDAGHILGSAIIRLRVTDRPGGEERVIVCSGDLGRPGTPILRDPTVMTAADYVLVESTYGGREHEPEGEADPDPRRDHPDGRRGGRRPARARRSRSVAPRKSSGSSIASSSAARSRCCPLYLDSPMASKASDIYRNHPDYYDEETAKLLRDGRHAARLPEPDRSPRT